MDALRFNTLKVVSVHTKPARNSVIKTSEICFDTLKPGSLYERFRRSEVSNNFCVHMPFFILPFFLSICYNITKFGEIMQQIDRIDEAIVILLAKDGRMSATEIARQIGNITPRIVRYRIERLLAQKSIRISAFSVPQEVGLNIIADVKVKVEPGHVLSIARKLAEYELVTYVGCSIGEGDIGIQVVASSLEEIYDFITETIGNIPGLRGTTTMIVPIILKDVYKWSIPQRLISDVEFPGEP